MKFLQYIFFAAVAFSLIGGWFVMLPRNEAPTSTPASPIPTPAQDR